MSRFAPFIALVFALVLGGALCPAEGFVLYEQHDAAAAAPLPQLRDERGQVVVPLNGPWEYRVGEKGPFRQGWIPCAFDGEAGLVTFRRTFVLAESLKTYQIQLHLPEAHHAVEVWINGTFISSFTGSHLAFSCLIAKDRLRFRGENEIELRVDGRLTPRTTFPVRPQLLHPCNMGGVFSGVYLRAVPSWSLEDVVVRADLPLDSTAIRATVEARIALYRPAPSWSAPPPSVSPEARVHAALRDSSGRILAEGWSDPVVRGGSESFRVTVRLPKTSASLWAPGHPALYELTATLVAGTDTLQRMSRAVGFAQMSVSGGSLLWNGRPLRVRGIDYIPEHQDGRRAVSVGMLRQDLLRIRELGFNTIRIPFGPPPLPLLDLADQLGMLVFVENSLDWIPGEILVRPSYRAVVGQSLSRLLSVCQGHPSVAAWGIGSNLDWHRTSTRDFTVWLREMVKEDDRRPCYVESTDAGFVPDLADFVLCSLGPECGGLACATIPASVPVLFSRISQLASAGGGNGFGHPLGAVEQAEYLIRQVIAVESDDAVDGFLIHCFADYHGSSPLLAQPKANDPLVQSFGIMSWGRQERPAYANLRNLAQTGQSSPLAPARTQPGAPIAFPLVGLAAMLLLSVEMRRNNVFRQNLKRTFLHAHGFWTDLRFRRFLHVAQPLLLWVIEAVTLSLLVASALHASRDSFALDYYLTHFLPWPRFKAWLVDLIWQPAAAIAYFTALCMAAMLVKAVGVRLLSLLFRDRVDFWQSANYVIWSLAALLPLLPLAVVFYRVIELPGLSTVAWAAVAAGLLWSVFRLLAALRTGFGASPLRVYGTIAGLVLVIVLAVVALLDSQLGTLSYLPFFHETFRVH